MSLIFFDGFDNEPGARIPLGASGAVQAATGRNGTDCIRVTGNEGPTVSFDPRIGTTVVTIGFAVWVESTAGGDPQSMLRGYRLGSEAWNLKHTPSTGLIVFNTVASNVATSSVTISGSAWHYIELVINTRTSGGSAILYIDGVEAINYSGDTTWSGTDGLDAIQFRGDNNLTRRFDDLYILDDAGTALNARLGDVSVKRLAPSAAGNYSQGVGSDGNSVDNHLLVDEAPADEADYVEMGVGNRESYAIPALGAGEVPLAVKVAAQVGGGTGEVDGFLRIGGVDYDAADAKAVALAYNWRDFYFETNPATAAAWAEDALDGAEIGVRRTA